MNTARRPTRVLLVAQVGGGPAWWRVQMPLEALRDYGMVELFHFPHPNAIPKDRAWLCSMDVLVMHQRWDDPSWLLLKQFKGLGKRVVLDVDDLVSPSFIDESNAGAAAYHQPGILDNIHDMLKEADWITTTTPTLRDLLSRHHGVRPSKFRIRPNMPSMNWMPPPTDGLFSVRAGRFGQRERKRIGVLSSLSHYDLTGSGVPTDMDVIEEAAALTGSAVTWVLFGKTKGMDGLQNVEVRPQAAMRDYPRMASSLDLDLLVVPLLSTPFNDCKSNIKLLEGAALGIPTIVSKSPAYDSFVHDPNMQFLDSRTLVDRLGLLRKWSPRQFLDCTVSQYRRLFCDESDCFGVKVKGYWLERNVEMQFETLLTDTSVHDGFVKPDVRHDGGLSS